MRRHRGHSLQIALEKLELFKHIGFVFNQGLCTPVFHPEAAFMDALTPGYICCSVKPTFIKSPESWSLSLSLQNHLYSYTNLSSLGCYPVHHFSVNRNHSCIKGQKCFAKEMYIAKEFWCSHGWSIAVIIATWKHFPKSFTVCKCVIKITACSYSRSFWPS